MLAVDETDGPYHSILSRCLKATAGHIFG